MTPPKFAVQAISTAPGVFRGCTINLWAGATRAQGEARLPGLEAKHGAHYRAFEVADLFSPHTCTGLTFPE